jgi:hypothetical protein
MVLGGNLHHYARFQTLVPQGIFWGHSHDEAAIEAYLDGNERLATRTPTREEFEFCRQFVVTTALRQADINAHVVRPSWETARMDGEAPEA